MENYCTEDIHNYLREEKGCILCPFCDLQLEEYQPKIIQKCCEKPNLIIDKGRVCTNCGTIDFNYKYISPYLDFYENKYKIRKKNYL